MQGGRRNEGTAGEGGVGGVDPAVARKQRQEEK